MEILESSLFLWGLVLGGVCLAISGLFANRRDAQPLQIGGILIAVASALAFSLGDEHSTLVWVAIGIVFLLTFGAEAIGAPAHITAIASLPGAVVMAMAAPADPAWFRLLVIAAIPVGGYLIDDFETRYAVRGLGVLFFGLAVAGTFLAVPDTELARAMVGVCFPIMFLAWPRVKISLGVSGAYMAMAVFSLSTTAGGLGRSASAIGAMACLGFLVMEPLAVRMLPRLALLPRSLQTTAEAAVLAALPQAVLVFVSSRVAGPLDSVLQSFAVVTILFALSFLLLLWVDRNRVPELDN